MVLHSYGTCKECVWGSYWICIRLVWGMCRICVGSLWDLCGTPMASAWDLYLACMGPLWYLHGIPTGSALELCGCVWDPFGTCIGSLWDVHWDAPVQKRPWLSGVLVNTTPRRVFTVLGVLALASPQQHGLTNGIPKPMVQKVVTHGWALGPKPYTQGPGAVVVILLGLCAPKANGAASSNPQGHCSLGHGPSCLGKAKFWVNLHWCSHCLGPLA